MGETDSLGSDVMSRCSTCSFVFIFIFLCSSLNQLGPYGPFDQVEAPAPAACDPRDDSFVSQKARFRLVSNQETASRQQPTADES